MNKVEDVNETATTDVRSEMNLIWFTENEGSVQLVHNEEIDGAADTNVSSENTILLTESRENSGHNIEEIDGATEINISSENKSILHTENSESTVQLIDNIKKIDRTADNNVNSENNSILLSESRGSTVKLSIRSFCYNWTVDNFFKCLNFCLLKQSADTHFNFNSPSFMFQNTEWYLHLSVRTGSEQNNSQVKEMKIALECKSNIASDLYIKNEVRIVDDDGKVLLLCSPKEVVGSGCRKEYYYSFLPLRGTKTFVLPYKLIVRNEFSTLISETCEDTGSSYKKYKNQRDAKSQVCTSNDTSYVLSLLSKCLTNRQSVLSNIRASSWSLFKSVGAEMRKFLIPISVVLCVLSMSISLVDQDHGVIPTNKSNEINHLIIDYAKKLNLIAEIHNLTRVKEKSLEILILYSKMYNNSDHAMQRTESSDHAMQSTESSDHAIQSPKSTNHAIQSPESTDHAMQSPESTDHAMRSIDNTDHVMKSTDNTDHVMKSTDNTDHVVESTGNTDHVVESTDNTDHVVESTDNTDHAMKSTDDMNIKTILLNPIIQKIIKKFFRVIYRR